VPRGSTPPANPWGERPLWLARLDKLSDLSSRIDGLIQQQRYDEVLAELAHTEGLIGDCLREAVADARRAKWSWPMIGRALGTSFQAAWERFSGKARRQAG
jgi:hypothetical protein